MKNTIKEKKGKKTYRGHVDLHPHRASTLSEGHAYNREAVQDPQIYMCDLHSRQSKAPCKIYH